MDADLALAELPRSCDWGFKKDTQGKDYWWSGYKAHIVWADGMIPLCCVTTSASLHDSQSAIPMMKRVGEEVRSLYDLMDSAYDSRLIREVSLSLGHVPIIARNLRQAVDFPKRKRFSRWYECTSEQRRYRERSNAERGNSRLKDSYGLRFLLVRGACKVHLHTMFGVLALFADQLLKWEKQKNEF
jgi:hypothetical protein